jgi:hypothetical protein
MRRKDLYLCKNYGLCEWEGSLDPINVCPVCGEMTFKTPCGVTGCSIFYMLGRNLRIRNTGSSMIAGQEGHVECADIGDLYRFIREVFPDEV